MSRHKHWYLITVYECPSCGRRETLRTRQYGKRPALQSQRHEYVVRYDWCDG